MCFKLEKVTLFLINLKVGEIGLNLTAADYVIYMAPLVESYDRRSGLGSVSITLGNSPVTIYQLVGPRHN